MSVVSKRDVQRKQRADRPNVERSGGENDAAEAISELVARASWIQSVIRLGWLAKAAVYAAMGWAAVNVALDRPSDADPEYSGLVEMLSDRPITRVLLGVVAVGLVFYIIFRVLSVGLIDSWDVEGWVYRVAYSFSALTYTLLAWTAGSATFLGTSPGESDRVEEISLALLGSGLGRIAVGLGGASTVLIAAYFVVKAVTRKFEEHVHFVGALRRAISASGSAGWIGRGLIVGWVGAFILWAAVDADPGDVRGMQSSTQRISESPGGAWLVGITGAALLSYSLYCVLTSSRRRIAWKNNPDLTTGDVA